MAAVGLRCMDLMGHFKVFTCFECMIECNILHKALWDFSWVIRGVWSRPQKHSDCDSIDESCQTILRWIGDSGGIPISPLIPRHWTLKASAGLNWLVWLADSDQVFKGSGLRIRADIGISGRRLCVWILVSNRVQGPFITKVVEV